MTDGLLNSETVLVFHKLISRLSYSVSNYSPRRFEQLLQYLYGETGRGRDLLISFDDGYQHLAEILPELMARFAMRPIIFIPTALIGRPNDWDYSFKLCPTPHLDIASIRRLAEAGAIFGSHGANHIDLTRCTNRALEAELGDSRKCLQDITGQPINLISYPFGRCNAAVRRTALEVGYGTGFTMNFPKSGDDPLARGRLPVYSFDTAWSISQKLNVGPAYQIERFKAATVSWLSGGTALMNQLRRSRAAPGVSQD